MVQQSLYNSMAHCITVVQHLPSLQLLSKYAHTSACNRRVLVSRRQSNLDCNQRNKSNWKSKWQHE